jgi:hypothetical protein
VIDIEGLVRQCLRYSVEPCLHSSFENAHRLQAVLPCSVHKLGQLGDPIELRWNFGNRYTLTVGDRIHYCGPFENCVTRHAQLCEPRAVEARTA